MGMVVGIIDFFCKSNIIGLMERLSRRSAVRLGSLFLAFSYSGCGQNLSIPNQCELASLSNKPSETVRYCYPEIAGREPQTFGKLKSTRGLYEWFNYSQIQFNPDGAARMISYFENLAQDKSEYSYILGKEMIRFSLKPTLNFAQLILIVDKQSSNPRRSGYGNNTLLVVIPQEESDFIYSKFLKTKGGVLIKDFATLACTSSIDVKPTDSKWDGLIDRIVATSWGHAFAIRQQGIPYVDYSAWAAVVRIGSDPTKATYPQFLISQERYDSIPLVVNVLT